jgi:hypothetical protein
MTKFEDQLYADLMQQHGPALAATQRPTASRRYAASRRVLLATGAGGIAVAAASGALAAGGGTPAYAVTTNHDGTVTLAVYQESGIAQANAELRQLGDRVVVVPVRPGCPSINSLKAAAIKPPVISIESRVSAGGSITVQAQGVPAGDIIVVGFETEGHGVDMGTEMDAMLTSPPAPSCVSLLVPPSPRGGFGAVNLSGSGRGSGTRAVHDRGSATQPLSGNPEWPLRDHRR